MAFPIGPAFDDQPLKPVVDGRAGNESQHFIDSQVEDVCRFMQRPFVGKVPAQRLKDRPDDAERTCAIQS